MASRSGHKLDTCICGKEKLADSRRCVACARGVAESNSRVIDTPPVFPPIATVDTDRTRLRHLEAFATLQAKYKEALLTIERLESAEQIAADLGAGLTTYTIEPRLGSGTAEGTVVVVASDWHIEERVTPGSVSGLNEFTLEIAHDRITRFFQSALRLTRLLQQDIRIDTMVLALLGDFVTNEIHGPDNAETNALQPMHALTLAQSHLISGIQFLLDNSKLKFVLPCHSGNHARTTQKTRFAAENGHSLEYLLYCHLAAYFRHEPRVTFVIPEGQHSYLRVYDTTIRFLHGHAVKYGGGVGGIYIPLNKAIAQWDKAKRADLTVLGHFHQLRDGGNFLVNGSLIGMNPFALAIKADFEPPKQLLFLIDKKRGRTCTWPLLLSDPKAEREAA